MSGLSVFFGSWSTVCVNKRSLSLFLFPPSFIQLAWGILLWLDWRHMLTHRVRDTCYRQLERSRQIFESHVVFSLKPIVTIIFSSLHLPSSLPLDFLFFSSRFHWSIIRNHHKTLILIRQWPVELLFTFTFLLPFICFNNYSTKHKRTNEQNKTQITGWTRHSLRFPPAWITWWRIESLLTYCQEWRLRRCCQDFVAHWPDQKSCQDHS